MKCLLLVVATGKIIHTNTLCLMPEEPRMIHNTHTHRSLSVQYQKLI